MCEAVRPRTMAACPEPVSDEHIRDRAWPQSAFLAVATVLGNEVFFRAFRNRREVGGYLGLAPSPWQSGGVRRDQGIAKSGDCDRVGLAVAAPSTGQRPDALVPEATPRSPRVCGRRQGNGPSLARPWASPVWAG